MQLLELVERIKQVAVQTGQEPVNSPLLDSDILIELLLPRVFKRITDDALKDRNQIHTLRQNHTITFTDGVAALPAGVNEQFAETMEERGANASTTSYCRQWFDFITDGVYTFNKFTISNGNIYYREAGEPYTDFDGAVVFNTVTIPQLPSAISDTVVLEDSLLQQVIHYAAGVIRGEIPLTSFGLDEQMFTKKR